MKIKRIIASDMREAMRQVRQLFGDEAVILSNRACPEGVELVAAIDFDEQAIRLSAGRQAPHRVAGVSASIPSAAITQAIHHTTITDCRSDRTTAELLALRAKNAAERQAMPQPESSEPTQSSAVSNSPADLVQAAFADAWAEFHTVADPHPSALLDAAPPPRSAPTSTLKASSAWGVGLPDEPVATSSDPGEALNELKTEMSQLRELFERQLSVLEWHKYSAAHPVELETRERLQTLGLPLGLAKSLAQAAAQQEPTRALSAALKTLGQRINVSEHEVINQGGIFAFIGPTGVGKTTTLAKIAAQAVLTHGRDSIALITTDRFRIGAQEQLRNYARIFNIPLHVARDEQHLSELLPAVADRRLVLIDTAGMSPRDLQMMNLLKKMPEIDQRVNLLLVLSAQAQYSAMVDAINRFQALPLAGMILTKLDETLLLGNALAALVHSGLPLVCSGVGQRVPEDLWYPSTSDLIKQAIELGQGEWARTEAEISPPFFTTQKVGA
ncbi:MAG: flagellar biosynthesis protein FlhF [Halothiobacillus sp.]